MQRLKELEYDPNRTSFIALIKYERWSIFIYNMPQKLKIGDKLFPQMMKKLKLKLVIVYN